MEQTQREELITRVARAIERWGMTAPAIMFLEANKPISFIAGQLLLVAEPILGFFVGYDRSRQYALLLEDQESVELLVQRLEAER